MTVRLCRFCEEPLVLPARSWCSDRCRDLYRSEQAYKDRREAEHLGVSVADLRRIYRSNPS